MHEGCTLDLKKIFHEGKINNKWLSSQVKPLTNNSAHVTSKIINLIRPYLYNRKQAEGNE